MTYSQEQQQGILEGLDDLYKEGDAEAAEVVDAAPEPAPVEAKAAEPEAPEPEAPEAETVVAESTEAAGPEAPTEPVEAQAEAAPGSVKEKPSAAEVSDSIDKKVAEVRQQQIADLYRGNQEIQARQRAMDQTADLFRSHLAQAQAAEGEPYEADEVGRLQGQIDQHRQEFNDYKQSVAARERGDLERAQAQNVINEIDMLQKDHGFLASDQEKAALVNRLMIEGNAGNATTLAELARSRADEIDKLVDARVEEKLRKSTPPPATPPVIGTAPSGGVASVKEKKPTTMDEANAVVDGMWHIATGL